MSKVQTEFPGARGDDGTHRPKYKTVRRRRRRRRKKIIIIIKIKWRPAEEYEKRKYCWAEVM